jgi:two-component system response regulator RegX3
MLTARAETLPESAGEASGTPAASLQQTAHRVRSALLRATRPEDLPEVIVRGGIYLDPARHECRVDGHPVFLPPKEFALLAYLMRNAGRVCSREAILAAVWRQRPELIRAVDVHMRWLRTLIEKTPSSPQLLLTVRGVGYLFVGE